MFTKKELQSVQKYLREKFGGDKIVVKEGGVPSMPAELYSGSEYIGAVYKNDDDGDLSYDLEISILKEDLE